MTETQFNEITEWQQRTFPNSTELSRVKHLIKEVDELKDEVCVGTVEEKEMEYADCFFLLFGAAKMAGMTYNDICYAIERKFEINRQRQWGRPDSDGVVNHLKT